MNLVEPNAKKKKPAKMGFDNHYFITGSCSCCGGVMPKWSGELWKGRCSDCAPELYEDPEGTLSNP